MVAATIDPTLIETMEARVGVETRGELTLGMTIMDTRHHFAWTHLPLIHVAYRADYRRFLRLSGGKTPFNGAQIHPFSVAFFTA